MSDKAIVKEILSENRAVVVKLPEERPHKECSGCGGCGAPNEKIETIALNLLDAKPGDAVYIESDERKSIKLLLILIGSPILIPLSFYLVGSSLGLPGVVSGGMAAFGLYMAYRIIKFYNKKVESEPPLTKIIEVQRNEKHDQITGNEKHVQITGNQ